MNREPIDLNGGTVSMLVNLSEGNPGAITVLSAMIKDTDNWIHLLNLDDMNIRGAQIWVGYKDHCGEKIEAFIECIQNRDPEMIDVINKECYNPEWGEDYTEKAVKGGASRRK